MRPDDTALAARVETLEKRVAALEAKAAPVAKPPAKAAPKPLRSASLRRLAVGESVEGYYQSAGMVEGGQYGPEPTITLAIEGALVTVACKALALQDQLRRAKPTPGDRITIERRPDGISQAGRTYHSYAVRVERPDEPELF